MRNGYAGFHYESFERVEDRRTEIEAYLTAVIPKVGDSELKNPGLAAVYFLGQSATSSCVAARVYEYCRYSRGLMSKNDLLILSR